MMVFELGAGELAEETPLARGRGYRHVLLKTNSRVGDGVARQSQLVDTQDKARSRLAESLLCAAQARVYTMRCALQNAGRRMGKLQGRAVQECSCDQVVTGCVELDMACSIHRGAGE